MSECAKFIEGYEGLYSIDRNGRIYSHKRNKYLSLKPASINGYVQVVLYKDGKVRMFGVHRLVAKTFIPNPNDLPVVNHRDNNRANNRVDNLEWCTQKENVHHAIAEGRHGKMMRRVRNKK